MTGGGRKIDRKGVHTPRPCSIITQPSSDEREVNLIDAIANQGFSIDLALQTSILPSNFTGYPLAPQEEISNMKFQV